MVIIQRMVKKNKKNIFQKEQREASRTSARLLQKYLGIKKKNKKREYGTNRYTNMSEEDKKS